MLVFDKEYVEETLTRALENYRTRPEASRAIALINHRDVELTSKAHELRKLIIESIERYLAPQEPSVYFCDDGDIFILSSFMPTKEARLLMIDLAAHFNMPVDGEWISLHELSTNANKLLVILEQKNQHREKLLEEAERQREALSQQRKRQSILSVQDIKQAQERIEHVRAGRSAPEIMMIEDDIFSRRLVENVLGKEYKITSLAEATYALETYTRIAPDLLLLDINLPDVSGHELLEKIILMDPHAYVVMISGNRDRDNILQAMNKGAMGFIGKPFTREKLFQYAERAFSKRK